MNNINNFNNSPFPDTVASEDTVNLPRAHSLRRNQVVYVRMTPEEKKRIVDKAVEARLSVARYLTRLALDGKSPLPAAEKSRIENLIGLFKRAEMAVGHLWGQANDCKLFSAMPALEEDFALATQTLSGLIRELNKRL